VPAAAPRARGAPPGRGPPEVRAGRRRRLAHRHGRVWRAPC